MALSSKGNFKISTTEYKPKSLKVTYDSLATSNSGRSDNGTMNITWVRTNIRKVEVVMPPMKMAELATLLGAVSGKKYNMTFHDPRTNAEVTVQMYTSTSSGECYSGVLYNGLYQGVEFHAIEV